VPTDWQSTALHVDDLSLWYDIDARALALMWLNYRPLSSAYLV